MARPETSLGVSRRITKVAWKNVLAVLLPQLPVLISVAVYANTHGPSAGIAVNLVANVFGVLSILGVGSTITVLRNLSIARRKKVSDPTALGRIVGSELAVSVILGAVSSSLFLPLVWLAGSARALDAHLVLAYGLGGFLWCMLTPVNLALNGALQALDMDGKNLVFAIATSVCQAASVALMATTIDDAATALFCTGAMSGLILLGAITARAQGLKGSVGSRVVPIFDGLNVRGLVRAMHERLQAGADGLVYMTTFFVASFVAATHSDEAGVTIALAISFFRLIVVPIKQFGLVGGRFVAKNSGGTLTLASIPPAALWICAPVAVMILVFGYTNSGIAHGVLPVLLALQLLLEPWAGVLFASAKVSLGPEVGVRLLMGVYWCGVVPALVLVSVLGLATPVGIWAVLLLGRFSFAVGTVRIVRSATSRTAD